METIQPATIKFLADLGKNNNRDWFAKQKDAYVAALENMGSWVDTVIFEMKLHDELENVSGKKSLYRIYNDVRFSKNKEPYSAKFACSLKRATKSKRGGYYLHIKPGNSFLACGFFAPNPEDLKRIRKDIEVNYLEWEKILNNKKIKANFGSIQGDSVSTVPRGFDINHPAIALLRHKQFIFKHTFTDAELLGINFHKDVAAIYKSIRPFFDYMSDVLTSNLNGESIL